MQRERAKLTRPDGSRVYGDAEHAERDAAILEAAAAEYDRATARYLEQAEHERARAEAELAKLDGDPFERLTADEQAKAAARQAFVKEDVETLPPGELVRLARATVAAKDRAGCYLYLRYLSRRPAGTAASAELGAVIGDLRDVLGLADQLEKRRELERRIEATNSLRGRVESARRRVDGRDERMLAGLRRQYAGAF